MNDALLARIQNQIGGMVLQILQHQAEIERLQALLAAQPPPPEKE